MAAFKNRKARKYSSVSVDGSTPVAASITDEKELAKKKLARAIKNSPKQEPPESSVRESETEQSKAAARLKDSRLNDSIEVIKSFLNFPKDTEFTVDAMVSEFLSLIKAYTELHATHAALLRKIEENRNRTYSQSAVRAAWN